MTARKILAIIVLMALAPLMFPIAKGYIVSGRAKQDVSAYVDRFAPLTTVLLARYKPSQGFGTATVADVPAEGDFSLQASGKQSLAPADIDALLAEWGSPAKNTGQAWFDAGTKYDIDAAIPLAMFFYESGAGTNPEWVGKLPNGSYSYNTGNIQMSGGFVVYDGWAQGIEAHIALLDEYRDTAKYGSPPHQHTSVRDALNTWAPPVENNTSAYADFVESKLVEWRRARTGQFIADGQAGPTVEAQVASAPPAGVQVASVPLSVSGGLGTNVKAALNASQGRLQEVVVPPGGAWSFNEAWGKPVESDYVVVSGVNGGGICDFGGRYSNAWHQLGLKTQYVYHGFTLNGLGPEDSTSIWNVSGEPGNGQDLILVNTSNLTAHLKVVIDGETMTVYGWLS